MNTFRTILLSLLLCCAPSVWADDVEVTLDAVTYAIDPDTKEAKVDRCSKDAVSVVIAETVEHEGVAYPVTAIGSSAFYYCTSLTSVSIPQSVTSIAYAAFLGCDGLARIDLPASLTTIDAYAFSGCKGLTSIDLPASVTSIGAYAFNYCTSLQSVSIPASVTEIRPYAFMYCTSLQSVSIPASVKEITDGVLSGCTSLTSVSLPASVTWINYGAFAECTSLTSIDLPSAVKSISYSAFRGCTALTSVTSRATLPPYCEDSAWDAEQYAAAPLYVPEEAIAAYQAAEGWRNFSNIKAIETLGIEAPNVAPQGVPAVVYDLQGRRLQQKQKGLNITNGKKVLVR